MSRQRREEGYITKLDVDFTNKTYYDIIIYLLNLEGILVSDYWREDENDKNSRIEESYIEDVYYEYLSDKYYIHKKTKTVFKKNIKEIDGNERIFTCDKIDGNTFKVFADYYDGGTSLTGLLNEHFDEVYK